MLGHLLVQSLLTALLTRFLHPHPVSFHPGDCTKVPFPWSFNDYYSYIRLHDIGMFRENVPGPNFLLMGWMRSEQPNYYLVLFRWFQ